MSNNIILLVGRVLLSVMFIISGIEKFFGLEGLSGYIGSVGIPAPMVFAWAAAIFETLVGIAILIGYRTSVSVLAMAVFCVFTAVIFHFRPGDGAQMISFMKNLTIAGGFLILYVAGPGTYAVDNRLRSGAYVIPAAL